LAWLSTSPPYPLGSNALVGQTCITCPSLELGCGQLHLNFIIEGGGEGASPKRGCYQKIWAWILRKEKDIPHNLENNISNKPFLPLFHLAITSEAL
jgi:hypothetical protein